MTLDYIDTVVFMTEAVSESGYLGKLKNLYKVYSNTNIDSSRDRNGTAFLNLSALEGFNERRKESINQGNCSHNPLCGHGPWNNKLSFPRPCSIVKDTLFCKWNRMTKWKLLSIEIIYQEFFIWSLTIWVLIWEN